MVVLAVSAARAGFPATAAMAVMVVRPVPAVPEAVAPPVGWVRQAVTRVPVARPEPVVSVVLLARRAATPTPLLGSPAMAVMVAAVVTRAMPVPVVPVSRARMAPGTKTTVASVAPVAPVVRAVTALPVARRVRAGPLGVRTLPVVMTASPVGLPLVPGVPPVAAAGRVSTPQV
jgi:hypothetical protein